MGFHIVPKHGLHEHSAAFVIWLPNEASEPGDEVAVTPVATPVRGRPVDTETPQSSSVGGKPTKPKRVLSRQVGRFQRVC